jgi:MFS family permease
VDAYRSQKFTKNLFDKFLASRPQGISQRTVESYHYTLTGFIGYPLTAKGITRYLDSLSCRNGKLKFYSCLRALFGWLCDQILAKYAWSIGLILTIVSILILMKVDETSPLVMVWLSSNFGLTNFGAIFGAISFFHLSGTAVGPLVMGYMFDYMGTYHWAFIVLLTSCAIAIPIALVVRRPKPL